MRSVALKWRLGRTEGRFRLPREERANLKQAATHAKIESLLPGSSVGGGRNGQKGAVAAAEFDGEASRVVAAVRPTHAPGARTDSLG